MLTILQHINHHGWCIGFDDAVFCAPKEGSSEVIFELATMRIYLVHFVSVRRDAYHATSLSFQ